MIDMLKGALEKTLTRFFGTKSERDLKRLTPLVEQILEEKTRLESLSDDELQNKTVEFRARLAEGETADDLMVEAFAVVIDACRRNVGNSWIAVGQPIDWDMIPFEVQIMGGIVLYQGKIAEMATGEGKTLVALFPLYLHGLTQKGAHLVTVNDYLAQRDSDWVGQMLRWLGLSVAVVKHGISTEQRRLAYGADVTYGTNNEFGFDYLRDNMVQRLEDKVQREHNFCIVDEVDSVLIDEARTPLIISGPVAHAKQYYDQLRAPVENLVREQNALVSRFMTEAEELLGSDDKDDNYKAYILLNQVKRGAPRHKRFMKLVSDDDTMVKRMLSVESDFMREKRAHVLDEDLLFSLDEKGHTVTVSEIGHKIVSPDDPDLFMLPDIAEMLGEVDNETDLTPQERVKKKEEIHRAYAEKSEILGNVQQLLKAFTLYERDKEYVVQDGRVLIVDEFTGRLMPGRRFSDGLHQALEAKERVKVGEENQTLATITIQNYFRLYERLAGMTGTAETEAGEFWDIYGLDVVVVPTNIPIARDDREDLIYKTKREKYNAIMDEIDENHQAGRPVLVGTVTVEVSETISRMLKRRGIKHHVLNAKYHQQEAEIITQAGQAGTVTIATNMAGRGTDIKLGEGVIAGEVTSGEKGKKDKSKLSGGLHIVGTERHESRRIDRQLRGRAGRQGDPGSSRFFLSLEDNLMRLFAPERIANMMDKLGAEEGEVITHPFMTKAIGQAQKKVEAHNFSIRKHLLQYDDVMNQQREVIYDSRNSMLEKIEFQDRVAEMLENEVDKLVATHVHPNSHHDSWDLDALQHDLQILTLSPIDISAAPRDEYAAIRDLSLQQVRDTYQMRESVFTEAGMREVERRIYLAVIDDKWRDHLHEIDQLKSGISWRAYAQKDPLTEYKHEAFKLFEELLDELDAATVRFLFRVVPADRPPGEAGGAESGNAAGGVAEPAVALPGGGPVSSQTGPAREVKPSADGFAGGGAAAPAAARGGQVSSAGAGGRRVQTSAAAPQERPQTVVRSTPKVGRNDPCPCGSGKKYKKCHGAHGSA